MELEGTELMDARRAAFRDRIPAELDIVGVEIPAGSRGWLLQDSIAACIVQKRVTGIARDAEVIAQSDLRGHRRCGAEFRIPYDEVTQYSHGVTHIITGPRCCIGGAPGEPDANFAIPIRREIGIHKSIVVIPNLPLRDLAEVRRVDFDNLHVRVFEIRIARCIPGEPDLRVGATRRARYRIAWPAE